MSMDRLINVFIGSSSESLSIAMKLKSLLENQEGISCTIWNDGIFEFNQTFLASLRISSYSFDFGIFVAGKDDIVKARGKKKLKARDNVMFEYGLFLGVMGNERTFLVQHEDVELPSDLLGYTTPRIKENFDESQWNELANNLAQALKNLFGKSHIQALPSTALAIGYYKSFLSSVSRHIIENSRHKILNENLAEYKTIKVEIIMPSELSDNIGSKARLYFEQNGFTSDKIGDGSRPFPIRFFVRDSDLVVVDMPTTLNAIRPAVNLLIPDNSLGNDDTKSRIERKELENFKKTLEYLISQDDYCKHIVSVIWQE